jgi:hypothetical protein
MGGKSRKAGQVSRKLIERLKQGNSPSSSKNKSKKNAPLLPKKSK